jgi:hypothetical protein
MNGPINVKSPKNISKWQMGFNLAFKGLILPESPVPIKQDAVSAHSRSGCFGEDTNFLLLPGCPASKFRYTKLD